MEEEPPEEPVESRFRAVFENAFDAIVVADDDGRYVDVNPAACELFGLGREELVGHRIDEFTAAEFDYDAEWAAFENAGGQTGQFPLQRPDGEVRHVQYAATRDIRPGEHLSILRDVTERIDQAAALEAQVERLDQFASLVSHDLRNPLAIAMGRLQLYRETGEASHYDAAMGALETIDGITDELLSLARGAEADGPRDTVDLAALAADVWSEVDTREADLEVVDEPSVRANRAQLRLLLGNCFRNAVGHGGSSVTVRVGPLPDGFYVEDTGVGIPAEDRDEVLKSGYTTGYGGAGVGLTIVQQVAAAHDWTVTVGESDAGGARFEFRGGDG